MATVEIRSDSDLGTTRAVEATSERGESLADWGLAITAAVGAPSGALAGSALGAEAGTAFPLACGTLGTMLGGGLGASVWCLLAPWTTRCTGNEAPFERNHKE